jgi:RNA polymerase primary sigma factor
LTEYNNYDFADSYGSEQLLSAAEEVSLISDIRAGETARLAIAEGTIALDSLELRRAERSARIGEKARERFVKANVRLAMHVARRYLNRGLSYEDLVQEGIFGVIHAIGKFEPERGWRFSTYAMPWVRQYISRAVINTGSAIRVPEHKVNEMNKLSRVRGQLLIDLGRDATDEEVAYAAEITTDELAQLDSYFSQPISIHTPVGEDDSELGDLLTDDRVGPEAEAVQADLTARLEEAFRSLNEKEVEVLRHRFNLGGVTYSDSESLAKISLGMGITRERVRQIEKTAIAKLRHPKNSHLALFLSGH